MGAPIGFFESPTTGNAVTWDDTGAQTDTGIPYTSYSYNSLSNRIDPSAYNLWADIAPTNYDQYVAKIDAGSGDVNNPLANWLSAGATPYTEAEYNAQNARAVADSAAGLTLGGGDTAESRSAQAAREAALIAPVQPASGLLASASSSTQANVGPPPTWQDTYRLFLAAHQARFGVDMNRPWTADADAVRAKQQIDDDYLSALAEYNKANGTSVQPDASVLGVNAQPNTFTPTDHSNDGFFGGLAKSLGMTTNDLGMLAAVVAGGYGLYSSGLLGGAGAGASGVAAGGGVNAGMTLAEQMASYGAGGGGVTGGLATGTVGGFLGAAGGDLVGSSLLTDGLSALTPVDIASGASAVTNVTAGTDAAGKIALATASGPLPMEALIAATGLTASEITAAGGVASGAVLGGAGLLTGTGAGAAAGAGAGANLLGAGAGNLLGGGAGGLLGAGANLLGGVLNQNAAKDAASTQADAQIRAAQIAADAAKFRPVGVKTNFGQSNFGYDDKGNLTSAGYILDPRLQAQQNQLIGASQGMLDQFTNSKQATAGMGDASRQMMGIGQQQMNLGQNALNRAEQWNPNIADIRAQTAGIGTAAQSAMNLGNQYLGTSPEQQAAMYMAQQQGLLQPGRASTMAALQAQMQAQGRGGFSMGGGVNGQGASNPQMQALYNAQMQQDAMLAAQSTQGGMDYAKFGMNTVNAGGDMLNNMYNTQANAYNPYQKAMSLGQNQTNFGMGAVGASGDILNSMYNVQANSYNPYKTAMGGAGMLEGLGQNAMQLGMDLGGKVTTANAAAGNLLANGMSNAANTVGAQAQQAGSLWGNLLQGGANALSQYKWGT